MGGDIVVQLDKPYYFIGDTVTGCVRVNLTKPKTVKGLILKVRCADETCSVRAWYCDEEFHVP